MAVYNYINDTGVIVPDSADINSQVNTEYQNLFGSDLVISPNTPQGMLISAEVAARIAVADNNAQLANQINPNLAGGVFLDAIMALTNPFGRIPATQSVVFATVTGVPTTVIPAGSIASETGSGDNNQFETIVDVTIPLNGTVTNVQFNSIQFGPIPSAADDLTVIVTGVLGWESITDSTAAILGIPTQSDIAARQYRLSTLATQASSTAKAITSGVLGLADVSSMSFLENTAATTQTIEGVSMVSHSIYACVNGTSIGTPSTVLATITGTPTTVIPAGSQASSNGYVFQTLTNTTIPGGGSISDVLFQALFMGPVPVPIGTLTTIVTPVSGWSTVTNPADAILGATSDIANALVSKKSAGASYNNGPGTNISVYTVVPFSGQIMQVEFDTPVQIAINVLVNVKISNSVQNTQQLVQQAILDYAAGKLEGLAGLTVGQNVSSFELAGAITSQNPSIYVQSLYIAYNPTSPTSPDELAIAVYQIATIAQGNIIVNVLTS